MTQQICNISGDTFNISDQEISLRKTFGFTNLPTTAPWIRFRELGAFWPHWNLHNRICDKSQQPIISVFSKNCPYPVWRRDIWVKESNPPQRSFNISQKFFEQVWELFQKCPIPHRTGTGNENCEYSSNAFYSKNCYLCEFPFNAEDLRYCYRGVGVKDSLYCAFCFDSELTVDAIYSKKCFDSLFVLNCQEVHSSAFLYDCRNCSECMFCCNLRNKKFCFENKQLTQEEYFKKKAEWDLKSRKIYDKAKQVFQKIMQKHAWHRALVVDQSHNSTGNYIENSKEIINCYFSKETESSCNVLRNLTLKSSLDCTSAGMHSELLFYSANIVDNCYQIKFCFDTPQSRFLEYCAYCFQCENCFGCCGLVGKKYHILNKEYSPEEYKTLREKIIKHMQTTNEWGQFFPGHFAPNPYNESWASYHFPLRKEEQKKLGFRLSEISERKNNNYKNASEIPDSVSDIVNIKELTSKIFWDEEFRKPFQISLTDIEFSKKIGCPLPNTYYMNRIQENFRWIPFDGKLRKTTCGKCDAEIQTSWPEKYDGRILCEGCYLGQF